MCRRNPLTKLRLLSLLLAFLLLSALPLNAQTTDNGADVADATALSTDEPTDGIPAPDEPTDEIPDATAIPTDAPVEVPTEPSPVATVELSPEPTVEVTPEPTLEVTTEPVFEATVEATSEAAPVPEVPVTPVALPLVYSTNFEAGFPAELGASNGWLSVAVENGQALQHSDGSETALYNASVFTDTEIEAKILLNSGDVILYVRKRAAGAYAAALSSDGTLKLLKNGEPVNSSRVTLTPGTWVTLKLSAVGTTVTAYVDNVSIVTAGDFAPLPAGQAGFGADAGTLVRVDDVAIYGIPAGVPELTVTPENTPEATAEAALPEITGMSAEGEPALPPVGLMSVDCPVDPNEIRVASQNSGAKIDGPNAVFQYAVDLSEDGRYVVFAAPDTSVIAGDTNGVDDTFRFDRTNCTLTRISVAEGGGEPNGLSYPMAISDDGNLVLLMSTATNLVSVSITPGSYQYYVRNISAGTTEIVSVDNSGNPASMLIAAAPHYGIGGGSMSSDGRYVVFTSHGENLVPGDTNNNCETDHVDQAPGIPEMQYDVNENCPDVFLRDRQNGTTVRVSLANNGSQQNGMTSLMDSPVVSDDGRYVAFATYATNLTTNTNLPCVNSFNPVTGTCAEIYVRDTVGNTTKRVSVADNEAAGNQPINLAAPGGEIPFGLRIAMSSNGQYIVFHSFATNLVASDTNNQPDIFVRDIIAGTTQRISLKSDGSQTDNLSFVADISEDGSQVSFLSMSHMLPGDVVAMNLHAYVYNRNTQQLERVSKSAPGVLANATITLAALSDSGSHVAFITIAPHLVAGDIPGTPDVFVTGVVFPPVLNAPSNLNQPGRTPTSITIAWNNNEPAATEVRIERSPNGTTWTEIATVPAGTTTYTDSGGFSCGQTYRYRVRAYRSSNNTYSVYSSVLIASTLLCSCNPDATLMYAASNTGAHSSYPSFKPDITPGGRYLAFSSLSFELVPGDVNGRRDVFRYDRINCTIEIVSVNSNEEMMLLGSSTNPAISDDGRYIAFTSDSPGLVPGDTNGIDDVFVRDMVAGTTTRVSIRTDGIQANQYAVTTKVSISQDGRYVAFASRSPALRGGGDILTPYVYDRQTSTLLPQSYDENGVLRSGDSPYVLLVNGEPYVVFASSDDLTEIDITGIQVYLRRMQTGEIWLISRNPDGTPSSSNANFMISDVETGGGNVYVVYLTASNSALFGDTNGQDDAYVRAAYVGNPDVGTTTRISLQPDGTQFNAKAAFYGTITADGRYATFMVDNDVLIMNMVSGQVTSTYAALQPYPAWDGKISDDGTYIGGVTNNSGYYYKNPIYTSPPPAPTGLTVTGSTSTSIALSWTDNHSDETNFRIERSLTGAAWSEIGTVAANITTFEDTSLSCGLTRHYRVRAYRASPETYTPYTNALPAMTVACPIFNAPSNLQATNITQTGITITWTDNSDEETNYRVERQIGPGSFWNPIATVAAGAGTGGTLTYTDNTRTGCGKIAAYRVRAYRAGDNSYTPFSNLITAGTTPCTGIPCPVDAAEIRMATQHSGSQVNNNIPVWMPFEVSGNGRYVVFQTRDITLPGGDHNQVPDAYRFDRTTCTLVRVSVALGGGEPNGMSYPVSISADGNLVLFVSWGSNLVSSAIPAGTVQFYLRNITAGTNELISVDSSENPSNAAGYTDRFMPNGSLSADGRYAVFSLHADNLVAGDNNAVCEIDGITTGLPEAPYDSDENCPDVFLRDRQSGTTTHVSVADDESMPNQGVAMIDAPVVSDDGRYVVFGSYASNLTADPVLTTCTMWLGNMPVPCPEIYIRDTLNATTQRVSVSDSEQPGNLPISANHENFFGLQAAISGDGRYIAFASEANNLVAGDTNGVLDVFVRDMVSGTTELVSRQNGGGLNNTKSYAPDISNDGNRVAFLTSSNTIMNDGGNNYTHAYVYNRAASQTLRVSKNVSGSMGNNETWDVQLTGDGSTAAFGSWSSNLVANDAPREFSPEGLGDIFVTGVTFPSVLAAPSNLQQTASTQTSVTLSWTDNSVGETGFRVYRRLSVWNETPIGKISAASGTGTTLNFTDTNLPCGQSAQYFVRTYINPQPGGAAQDSTIITASTAACTPPPCTPNLPLALISTGTNGVPPGIDSAISSVNYAVAPLISANGQYIVFESYSNNLVPGDTNFSSDIFRYDRLNCTLARVSSGNVEVVMDQRLSQGPSISADANLIAFESDATDIVAGVSSRQIYVRDMTAGTTELVSVNGATPSNGNSSHAAISADGRYVVFASQAGNLTALPMFNPSAPDVYLYDRQTDTVAPVSINSAGTAMGNGISYFPGVVEVNGSPYVVFMSGASDLVAGDTNGVEDVFVRDVAANTTYRLSLGDNEQQINSAAPISDVIVDATHLYVAFSTNTSLSSDDTNSASDGYLRTVPLNNLANGTTTLLTRINGVNGTVGNSHSGNVHLDSSRRFVVFISQATNLVAGDTNGVMDVFRRDLVTGTTTRLSVNGASQANADVFVGDMSAGGNVIVFHTSADNLVAGDTNAYCEYDYVDEDPVAFNSQYDFNENCADVFIAYSAVQVAPAAPTNLQQTGSTGTSISLSWTDASSDETNFRVERSLNGTTWTEIGTVAANVTTFTNGGLACGQSYQYRVRAYRASDSSYSVYSPAVTATTTLCPMGAAGTLTASINQATQINLAWSAIPNADEYRIERNTGSGFVEVATVAVPTLTYNDTGLSCGYTFQYRVRGYQAASASFSAYKPTAAGKTLLCGVPTLNAPANAASFKTPITFSWQPVPNAQAYELFLASDAAFNNPASGFPIVVTNTSHTLSSLPPDGIYYWRVRVTNHTPVVTNGGFSLLRSLTVDFAPPPVPVPQTPANLATVNGVRPSFTWSYVIGAVLYQFEINDDATFTNLAEYTGTPVATVLTMPAGAAALLQGDYYWRVRAVDVMGNVSDWSSPASKFTVNLMVAPLENALMPVYAPATTRAVTFSWAAVVGATAYTVQVDDDGDGDFSSNAPDVLKTCPSTYASCTLNNLTFGVKQWRVLVGTQLPAATHPYRTIRIAPPAPLAPLQTAPAVNALISFNTPLTPLNAVDFAWSAANGYGAALTYRLEINTINALNTLPEFEAVNINATQLDNVDLSMLPDGIYWWRVQAFSEYGVPGALSAVRAFTLDTTPPPAPVPTVPAQDGVVFTVRPTLAWQYAAGAVRYQVDISTQTGADFAAGIVPGFENLSTVALSLVPVQNLPEQRLYYWRVQGVDAAGNIGAESTPRSFMVNTLNYPPNNAIVAAGTLTFYWYPVPGATGYQVRLDVDGDADFSTGTPKVCPVSPANVGACSITGVPAGVHHWQVIASNSTSPVRTLTAVTGGVLPAATALKLDGVTTTGTYKTDAVVNSDEKTDGILLRWTLPAVQAGLPVSHFVAEFSATPLFNPIIASAQTADGITNNVLIPGDVLLSEGVKYARVRAIYGAGSSVSALFALTVDTIAPPKPVINLPAGYALSRNYLLPIPPVLSWKYTAGAAGYLVDIEYLFELRVDNAFTTALTYTIPPAVLGTMDDVFNAGAWAWSVQSVDSAGNRSPTAGVPDFGSFFLGINPPLLAVNQPVRPFFQWQPYPGATGYVLQVSRNGTNNFSNAYTKELPAGVTYFAYPTTEPALSGVVYWRVYPQGVTAFAGAGAFTVGGTPPVLTLPVSGDTYINNAEFTTPQLAWQPAAPAASLYMLQIADNPSFINAAEVFVETAPFTLSSHLTTVALSDGLKYWRMATATTFASNRVIGPFSAIGTFTLDRTATLAPTNLNVSPGAMPTRPLLYWTAPVGAGYLNAYRLDISQDNFATFLPGYDNRIVNGTTFMPAVALQQGTYQYRVRALDIAGNISSNSATFTFVVNTASYPPDNTVVDAPTGSINQVFTWFAVTGATSYRLEVDTGGDGSFATGSGGVQTCTTTALSCTMFDLPRGTHAWRVLVNGFDPSAEIRRTLFITGSPVLPAPVIKSINEDISAPPLLNDSLVSAAERAGGVKVLYTIPPLAGVSFVRSEIQVSTSPAFTPALTTTLPDNVNDIPADVLAAEGVKYVRIRTKYFSFSGDVFSPYSVIRAFTVDVTAPTAPVIITPLGGLIVSTRTPTLVFGGVATAVRYRVELATSNSFGSTTVLSTIIPATAYVVPNVNALANGAYFWKVTALDAAGNEGTASAIASFIVAAP